MMIKNEEKFMNKIEMDSIEGIVRVDKAITQSEMNAISRKIQKELEKMTYIPKVKMGFNGDILMLDMEFYNPFGKRFGSVMFTSGEDLNKYCYELNDIIKYLEDDTSFTLKIWEEYCDRLFDDIASILNNTHKEDEAIEYCIYLCDILGIAPIQMEGYYDIEGYHYDKDSKVIYYCPKEEYDIVEFASLSKAVRYAWQDITNPEYYFENCNDEMSEQEMINSRSEIDANAFVTIAIAIAFKKVLRIVNTMGDANAQAKYDERVEELKKQFGLKFTQKQDFN